MSFSSLSRIYMLGIVFLLVLSDFIFFLGGETSVICIFVVYFVFVLLHLEKPGFSISHKLFCCYLSFSSLLSFAIPFIPPLQNDDNVGHYIHFNFSNITFSASASVCVCVCRVHCELSNLFKEKTQNNNN